MARSVMLDQWMAEMKQLSAATAKAEATRKVAIASAQQVRAWKCKPSGCQCMAERDTSCSDWNPAARRGT